MIDMIRAFWNSTTTRAIAITSVVGLFIVYVFRAWKSISLENDLHQERIDTLREFDKNRMELKGKAIEDINAFEEKFQSKLAEINHVETMIKADVSHSRERLADALNKSFGK